MSEGKRVRKHNPNHDMALDAPKHMGHVMGPYMDMDRGEIFESVVRDCANFGIYYSNLTGERVEVDNQRIDRLTDLAGRIETAITAIHGRV